MFDKKIKIALVLSFGLSIVACTDYLDEFQNEYNDAFTVIDNPSSSDEALSSEEGKSSGKKTSSSSEEDDSGKSSGNSSSSAKSGNNLFDDIKCESGDLWCKDSYGLRLATYFKDGKNKSGYWYDYSDKDVGGKSKIIWPVERGSDELDKKFVQYCQGICGTVEIHSGYEYPFAGVGFNIAESAKGSDTPVSVDVSDWGGICVTYLSENEIKLQQSLGSNLDSALLDFDVPVKKLSKTSSPKEVCLAWTDFKQEGWGGKEKMTGLEVARKLVSLNFKLEGRDGTLADFNIIRLRKNPDGIPSSSDSQDQSSSSLNVVISGSCGPVNDTIDLGGKTAWKFIKDTSVNAEVVLNSDYEWSFEDGSPKTSSKQNIVSSDEITYSNPGAKKASVKITPLEGSPVTIECSPLHVKGAPITGCVCDTIDSYVNVDAGDAVASWKVTGCSTTNGRSISYKWVDDWVTSNTTPTTSANLTTSFGFVQPTVIVTNDDSTKVTLTCPSVHAKNSHPSWAFLKEGGDYSEVKDSRDGKRYKTITVGGQTWMAENVSAPVPWGTSCYKEQDENCATYGHLYSWTAAQAACMPGWHLPTTAEWYQLIKYLEGGTGQVGYKIKSAFGWGDNGGSNSSGLSVAPAGKKTARGAGATSEWTYLGKLAVFWTADKDGGSTAHYVSVDTSFAVSTSFDVTDTATQMSVRCVLGEASADKPVCEGKNYASGDHNFSVTVGGKKRTFIMHVPEAYTGDSSVPLVVDYHPVAGDGSGQLTASTFTPLIDSEGVISLYPDGAKGNMGPSGPEVTGWNLGPCCTEEDDVEFTRAMIDLVEDSVCIDKKRVYATGFSLGGGMANYVACEMSDIFAAVAGAGMDLNTVNSAECNPERPISVINFRGTNDGVCRYQGGDSGQHDGMNYLGALGNFQFWAEKNGCTGTSVINSDGCSEYSNCSDGTKVVLCTDKNYGDVKDTHGYADGSIAWPFLKQFTLP